MIIDERDETALHQTESENLTPTEEEVSTTEQVIKNEEEIEVAIPQSETIEETESESIPETLEAESVMEVEPETIPFTETIVEETIVLATESEAVPFTEVTEEENKSLEATEIQTNEAPQADVQLVEELVEDHDDEHEQGEDAQTGDYANYTKADFLKLVKEISEDIAESKNFKKAINTLREIKPYFDEIVNGEKEIALQQFLAEGGEAEAFDFVYDKDIKLFYQSVNQIYKNRNKHINQLEEQKQKNLERKNEILARIRTLTDAEENNASIDELKKLQIEWKSIGIVPPQHIKSTWASYNALLDQFYNKLSIYTELKELDRRKNLALKLVICEKAEKLADYENVQQAIRELNELHEEYKHIGPVPKEEQEALWQRFKLASDKVYDKKREFGKQIEEERKLNLEKKLALCEEVKPYTEYQSDKITDWNNKTKDLLNIQKKWDEIRFIPRERAKELSKEFWGYFKIFFNNKNNFIRTLDEERERNLALKTTLCEEAESLNASNEDPRRIADKLKELQFKWKEIGPVPGKVRDSIYFRFKTACDAFFEKRREEFNSQEKVYEDNLKKKQELCEKIDQFNLDNIDGEVWIKQFLDEWKGIGFVPKKDKSRIQNQFETSLYAMVNRMNISKDEKESLDIEIDIQLFKESPNAGKKVMQKESVIKRQIQKLETDIDVWNNNIGFLASSNKASKLKEDIEKQIKDATEKLKALKKQLRVFQNL